MSQVMFHSISNSLTDAEHSVSILRHLKSYLRSTMGQMRLTGLALPHVNYGTEANLDKVLIIFAGQQPRRMLIWLELNVCAVRMRIRRHMPTEETPPLKSYLRPCAWWTNPIAEMFCIIWNLTRCCMCIWLLLRQYSYLCSEFLKL